jgi:hypothetical protein
MIPYLFSTTKLFLKTLIIHCLRTQATTANFVLSGINKDTSKTQDRIVILQLKYFRAIYPRHLVVIRVPKGHRANKHSPRHQLSRHCYKWTRSLSLSLSLSLSVSFSDHRYSVSWSLRIKHCLKSPLSEFHILILCSHQQNLFFTAMSSETTTARYLSFEIFSCFSRVLIVLF